MQIGDDRLLYIYSVDDFYPVGCLTSNSFSEQTEMLDATMRTDTDGWTQSIPSFQSYSLSFSGVLNLDDRGSTILTYETIKTLKRARTKIQWKIISAAGDSEEGDGYITQLSNAAETQEFVTFDGEIIGVGQPASTAYTPTAPPELTEIEPYYSNGKA